MLDDAALDRLSNQWRTEGWALAESLIPRDVVDQACDELRNADLALTTGPARRADAHVRRNRRGAGFRVEQFDGTTLFPVPSCPVLNRLFVDEHLIGLARRILGDDDLRIYQSRVWSKYGDHTNYEQTLHRDGNHSLIPIRNEPGWWHLECFVYLNDVDATNGAPRLVPNAPGASGIGYGPARSRDDAPELYDREVGAAGPAGSVLTYRSDVWHRGVDLESGTERHVGVVAFRPASVDWIGFDAHAPLISSADFAEFVGSCTPEELALFGIPRPGHEYWTAEVLDIMAKTYPDLDLDPWRKALA